MRRGFLHAQRDGRFHNHFVAADGFNVVGGNALCLQQFEKIGGETAGNGAFAGNFTDHHIIARIEDHLAFLDIACSPVRKDEPVLPFVFSTGDFINVF